MSGAAGVGHLSIGEVLALVQEDFPDVTISKIRFLESQGLIAPERTAAGYRKFYDSDIERLRWILRQQRDHFLPLKVIRKMLDQGVDVSPEGQPTLWSSAASGPASGGSEEERAAAERAIDVTDAGRSGGDEPHAGEGDGAEDADEAEERADDEARAAYRSAAHPAVASSRRERAGGPRSERTAAPSNSTSDPSGSAGAATEEAPGRAERSDRPAYATPADVVAALQEEPRSRRSRRATEEREEAPEEPAAPAPAPAQRRRARTRRSGDDVRMTRGELCEASGVSPELLADLEEYGLVEATVLGGDPQYGDDALEVAKIAARYAELGVGARHLRMYKVAAEREAGFVEQLVVPLLKQRNPAAREQAVARSEELQEMGVELHAALLRRRLGPSFGH